MSGESVVERACRLPRDFHELGNLSTFDLVRQSGYLDLPETLASEAAADFLRRNPSLVEDWLIWSSDKRVGSGWAFYEKSGGYIVELVPAGKDKKLVFADKFLACAEYVVRELRWIAGYISDRHGMA
jgi:hypothetical protein